MPSKRVTPFFWTKVDKHGPVPPERPDLGPCWLWRGSLTTDGYGHIGWRKAHRLTYTAANGPIAAGMQLDHLCRVRHCVNPAHLEQVTNRTNGLRGRSFAALNAAKTHCAQGHPFTPENTRWQRNPGQLRRVCRTCERQWQREYRSRKREARAA